MYNFAGQSAPNSDFSIAIQERLNNLPTLTCEESLSASEHDRFQYDSSEGLDTIVNNVEL